MFEGRRLEIVATDCRCVDTTMVCFLSYNGVVQRGTANTDGKSLARARRRKDGTPEQVLLGVEVGGRWSVETSVFLSRWSHSIDETPSLRCVSGFVL